MLALLANRQNAFMKCDSRWHEVAFYSAITPFHITIDIGLEYRILSLSSNKPCFINALPHELVILTGIGEGVTAFLSLTKQTQPVFKLVIPLFRLCLGCLNWNLPAIFPYG